jgi:hypothetical protein
VETTHKKHYYLQRHRSHGDPDYLEMHSTDSDDVMSRLYGENEMGYSYGTHIVDSGSYEDMKRKYPEYFND